jgi:hypothetical protein
MNCRKVKNLLSSYIDSELSGPLQEKVAQHLKDCPACRKLEMDLRMLAVAPFKQADYLKAPEHIWSTIRDRIIEKETKKAGLLQRVFTPFLIRKPVLAFATITLCILVAVLLVTKMSFKAEDPAVSSYLQEQIDFISRLSNGGTLYNGQEDFGTSIEEFLL